MWVTSSRYQTESICYASLSASFDEPTRANLSLVRKHPAVNVTSGVNTLPHVMIHVLFDGESNVFMAQPFEFIHALIEVFDRNQAISATSETPDR